MPPRSDPQHVKAHVDPDALTVPVGPDHASVGSEGDILLLRLQFLKRRGDHSAAQGNHRDAITSYTEALEAIPDSLYHSGGTSAPAGRSAAHKRIAAGLLPSLLSNRSRALCHAGRFPAALQDARALCDLLPLWAKGRYRAGKALEGLQRYADAAREYISAYRLEPGGCTSAAGAECLRAAAAAVQRLSVHELAEELLATASQAVLQAAGVDSAGPEHGDLLLAARHVAAPGPGEGRRQQGDEQEGAVEAVKGLVRDGMRGRQQQQPEWPRGGTVLGSDLYQRLRSWLRRVQVPVHEALVLLAAAWQRGGGGSGGQPQQREAAAAAARCAAVRLAALLTQAQTSASEGSGGTGARAKQRLLREHANGAGPEHDVQQQHLRGQGEQGKVQGNEGNDHGKGDKGDEEAEEGGVERLMDQLAEAHYLLGCCYLQLSREAALLPPRTEAAGSTGGVETSGGAATHDPSTTDSKSLAAHPPTAGAVGASSLPEDDAWRARRLVSAAIRCLAKAASLAPACGGPRAALVRACAALDDGEAASAAVSEARRLGPLQVVPDPLAAPPVVEGNGSADRRGGVGEGGATGAALSVDAVAGAELAGSNGGGGGEEEEQGAMGAPQHGELRLLEPQESLSFKGFLEGTGEEEAATPFDGVSEGGGAVGSCGTTNTAGKAGTAGTAGATATASTAVSAAGLAADEHSSVLGPGPWQVQGCLAFPGRGPRDLSGAARAALLRGLASAAGLLTSEGRRACIEQVRQLKAQGGVAGGSSEPSDGKVLLVHFKVDLGTDAAAGQRLLVALGCEQPPSHAHSSGGSPEQPVPHRPGAEDRPVQRVRVAEAHGALEVCASAAAEPQQAPPGVGSDPPPPSAVAETLSAPGSIPPLGAVLGPQSTANQPLQSVAETHGALDFSALAAAEPQGPFAELEALLGRMDPRHTTARSMAAGPAIPSAPVAPAIPSAAAAPASSAQSAAATASSAPSAAPPASTLLAAAALPGATAAPPPPAEPLPGGPATVPVPKVAEPALVPPHVVPLLYRLVTVDGKPFDGPQAGMAKHPFCLSRVYYDAKELPGSQRQAWCQLSDGSCRWRQSASEVQIIVLKVPKGLPGRRLRVVLGAHKLHVEDRLTGEVYLSGTLHRGVSPDSSFWTVEADDMPAGLHGVHAMPAGLHGVHAMHAGLRERGRPSLTFAESAAMVTATGGERQAPLPGSCLANLALGLTPGRRDAADAAVAGGGCFITLTKMNLELLARSWRHSEMWWSKLFEWHPEIAWDDYEKDYSDLPRELLEPYLADLARRREAGGEAGQPLDDQEGQEDASA